jgi:hypothetical protein
MINVERSRQKTKAIPDAKLMMIAGSGHLPTLERPVETMATLSAWIGRLPLE